MSAFMNSADRPFETFRVQKRARAVLVDFMKSALIESGCAIIRSSPENEAPFRVTFVPPWGGRMGIVAYAFLANQKVTKNRPQDEHRFQLKYSSNDGRLHEIWQDPYGLYTTLLVGINPQRGFFIGADPVLNSPTRFFISKEFKETHVDRILADRWFAWDRDQRPKRHQVDLETQSVETMVGATPKHLLKYVLFEREVRGEDQGHRHLVADRFHRTPVATAARMSAMLAGEEPTISPRDLHGLEREFDLSSNEILELIVAAPRLKMAVRGWVAERHLQDALHEVAHVRRVESIEEDGRPDFRVEVRGGQRPVFIECKNVLRGTDKMGRPRLDFQKTRAAKGDPCSRYYSPHEFHVVAACLHANTERWEFAARLTAEMAAHKTCPGRLAQGVVIDESWSRDLGTVLDAAAA